MKTQKQLFRKPTLPGEILLEEYLKPLQISQTAFAKHLKWSQPKVNEIIQGKRGITAQTALAFADAFGTTPEFWLNAQLAVDLWKANHRHVPVSLLAKQKRRKLAKVV